MTTYIASVRDKETKEVKLITRDYPNKKAFREDLYGNGYSVRFITTEDKFDEDCEKWYWACKKSNEIHKAIYAHRKAGAKRLGMTMAEYMRIIEGK